MPRCPSILRFVPHGGAATMVASCDAYHTVTVVAFHCGVEALRTAVQEYLGEAMYGRAPRTLDVEVANREITQVAETSDRHIHTVHHHTEYVSVRLTTERHCAAFL